MACTLTKIKSDLKSQNPMSTDFFFIYCTSKKNNNNNNLELAPKKVNHRDFVQKPGETITYRGFLLLGCFNYTKIWTLQTPAAH